MYAILYRGDTLTAGIFADYWAGPVPVGTITARDKNWKGINLSVSFDGRRTRRFSGGERLSSFLPLLPLSSPAGAGGNGATQSNRRETGRNKR